MINKPLLVVLLSASLYAGALVVSWAFCTRQAERKSEKLLIQSEKVFTEWIEDEIDGVMQHCGGVLAKRYKTLTPLSYEDMRTLVDRFNIDEINFIDTNGNVVATSDRQVVGYNFFSSPQTAEFMKVLKGRYSVSQQFRKGKSNSECYRKYLALAFPDRSGLIQLGVDFARVSMSVTQWDKDSIVDWKIGRHGYYDLYDEDQDGICDYSDCDNPDGVTFSSRRNGERLFVRPFSYAGWRFVSVLSEREYFEQRNLEFMILVPTLAVIILFMAFFVRSLALANAHERRRHLAEARARKRDLSMARLIQLSSLPQAAPLQRNIFSCSFDAATHPAKEVGGDFYDFYPVDKSRMAVVMADVSGKGISAAMYMMRAKNEICNAVCSHRDLAEALETANERLCEHNEAEMFVTAWVGVLDFRLGEIEYVNAGHNRPFIRRADGRVEKVVGKGGCFLGMLPGRRYRSDHLVFSPGDSFFLFTDGVTEAMDVSQRIFGERRLVEVLRNAPQEPRELIDTVFAAVRAHASGADQSDDITALALVWHGVADVHARKFAATEESFSSVMTYLREKCTLRNHQAVSRLLNATDEIITNIVSYSGASFFQVRVENAPGRTRLTFIDDGREYNPLSHVDPDTHQLLADRPIGGLGILMAKKLVDQIAYSREEGRNLLSITKQERNNENRETGGR